jgi:hypothetical protein
MRLSKLTFQRRFANSRPERGVYASSLYTTRMGQFRECDVRPRHYGVRWQAKRDTALSSIPSSGLLEPAILTRPKALSPLHRYTRLARVSSGSAMFFRDIMECGGKRSATPLCRQSRQVVRQNQRSPRGPKRRRRCALPAHSIGSGYFRSTLDICELRIRMRPEGRDPSFESVGAVLG